MRIFLANEASWVKRGGYIRMIAEFLIVMEQNITYFDSMKRVRLIFMRDFLYFLSFPL